MPVLKVLISSLALLGLLTYWLVAFVILYHLTRFGVGVQPKRFSAVFLLGSMALFVISVISFTRVDLTTLLP